MTDYPLKQEVRKCIEKHALAKHNKQENWDLYISITVPNEFKREGKFNVGVSAMVETDRVSHQWIKKCNEMDLIIVPSEHSRKVLEGTVIDWENQKTGEKGSFKFNKPVVVCNEGVDTNIFRKFGKEEIGNKISSLEFEPEFNFLHVGQWSKGGYGEDRKNIALLVKYFIETFLGRKDVGLVLKLNMAKNSIVDHQNVHTRLKEIKSNFKEEDVPPIYLIHGNLNDIEMASLYNHPQVKAFISLTHGEGFGLPLVEAAACGLPIVATNWSGHLDFLNKGKFSAIKYDMVDIPECVVWDPILIKESRWAQVQEEDTKHRMKKMVSSYSKPKEWAEELNGIIKEEFDVSVTNQHFIDTLKMGLQRGEAAPKIDPVEHLRSYIDTPNDYNVIYTMPMSAGDVFISTAVINGLKAELPESAKIYFATDMKYRDILKNNPDIYKIIPWNQGMIQVDLLEEVFDLALTPNIPTQFTFSNWIRRGQGRFLAEEFANHCQCELGEYHIEAEKYELPKTEYGYITLHPGSGKGQWEARKYVEWEETVQKLSNLYPDLRIIQVGSSDEPLVKGVWEDLRGKTNVHQLVDVIKNSKLHLSIDTFTMHIAASFDVPVVALFGSSHAMSTGPWVKDRNKSKIYMLEADKKMGCSKACYKYTCKVNKDLPCINEIDPRMVVEACARIIDEEAEGPFKRTEGWEYKPVFGKISGYTTTYNCETLGIPYVESIKSMLGFCDEVVVLDGCSDDGTFEKLEQLAETDEKLQIHQNPFDWEEPGIDGLQKAYARALCEVEHEFLWQQDCDEVVHEDDYEKIKHITKRFPTKSDILHLPVIELWGDEKHVTGRRHCWKWRMSRNKVEITHGINKHAKLTNEETGKVYAKKGMSDGCEYIQPMSEDPLGHVGFYNSNVETTRVHLPSIYEENMNGIFQQLPSVFHYSWVNIPKKINQLKKGGTWDKLWSLLYQEESQNRFPESEEEIQKIAEKLYEEGGEEEDKVKYKFELKRSNPSVMKDWLEKNSGGKKNSKS
jgi:ADP-heptose:LPS heptosyltransferase/glycosyltransferase involved in cell wall biosynthesis